MALRTTDDMVGEVVEWDEDIPLSPFKTAANLIVNRVVVPAKNADGSPYYTDEDELAIIETWLAAHFYCIRDPRTQFEGVKSIMTRFQTKVDLGLSVTHYGQQAIRLDTSGNLASFDRSLQKGPIRRRISLHWLGTLPEEEP